MNDKKKYFELLDDYYKKIDDTKKYLNQFFICGWEGKFEKKETRVLTKSDLEKIKKLREIEDKAYRKWFEYSRS